MITTTNTEKELWAEKALCANMPDSSEIFFSEDLEDIVAAKKVCNECPVLVTCLEQAIMRAEPCGVWGGQLFAKGKILAQKRGRGRPSKNATDSKQFQVKIPEELLELIA